MEQSAIIIQRWWKERYALQKVVRYLQQNLDRTILQDLSNKCHAIQNTCKGDGAGLEGGSYIDRIISEFFEDNLKEYKSHHNGESDMKIFQTEISLKKISGPSMIALDWSKNNKPCVRTYFNHPIMIVNLKEQQWWKKKEDYTDIVPSGIYLIDREYCQRNITLSSNNKTNTLITKESVYQMLQRSLKQRWFIELPPPNKKYKFKISNAFSES